MFHINCCVSLGGFQTKCFIWINESWKFIWICYFTFCHFKWILPRFTYSAVLKGLCVCVIIGLFLSNCSVDSFILHISFSDICFDTTVVSVIHVLMMGIETGFRTNHREQKSGTSGTQPWILVFTCKHPCFTAGGEFIQLKVNSILCCTFWHMASWSPTVQYVLVPTLSLGPQLFQTFSGSNFSLQ